MTPANLYYVVSTEVSSNNTCASAACSASAAHTVQQQSVATNTHLGATELHKPLPIAITIAVITSMYVLYEQMYTLIHDDISISAADMVFIAILPSTYQGSFMVRTNDIINSQPFKLDTIGKSRFLQPARNTNKREHTRTQKKNQGAQLSIPVINFMNHTMLFPFLYLFLPRKKKRRKGKIKRKKKQGREGRKGK